MVIVDPEPESEGTARQILVLLLYEKGFGLVMAMVERVERGLGSGALSVLAGGEGLRERGHLYHLGQVVRDWLCDYQ